MFILKIIFNRVFLSQLEHFRRVMILFKNGKNTAQICRKICVTYNNIVYKLLNTSALCKYVIIALFSSQAFRQSPSEIFNLLSQS